MKKHTFILTALMLITMCFGKAFAQKIFSNKIGSDLLEEMVASRSADEKFNVIIVMAEQFDAQKMTRQTQLLDKRQRRELVINELQQVSKRGQKEVMQDLQQGQKAQLVDDIRNLWIFNGICCSMTKDMVQAIAERPDVKFVVKDHKMYPIDGEEVEEPILDRASNQWNVTKVNANQVWDLGYTGEGVVVAVLDTGVNYNHTDIANNMWDGGEEFPHHGWDFLDNDNDPMDNQGHGTHCAGTVSSYGTNGKQCGIAKDAKIMALRVIPGNTAIVLSGIEFALSNGADILSMSLGADGVGGTFVERLYMENVLHCGVVASVAAGNTGDKLAQFPIPFNVGSPGNCPSPWHNPDQTIDGGRAATVTVGSTTKDDTHSSFSSTGPVAWNVGDYIGTYNDYPWIENNPDSKGLFKPDISAPGSSVISLIHNNNTGYTTKSGTSMATPCVAGVMALMLQANPTLTPMEIDSIIETTAVKLGGQQTKNNTFGAGRIDALAAINYMLNACAAPIDLTADVNGADVELNWTAADNVSSYRVYRNGKMIANYVQETTYTDANAPAGINTYYVRSNGDNNQASISSNQVNVTLVTNHEANAPSNLTLTSYNPETQAVTLEWTAAAERQGTLSYTNTTSAYTGLNDEIIAAQKYTSSMLQPYAGMQIERVGFSVFKAETECTIRLYEGDAMAPGILLHEGIVISTEDEQSIDYQIEPPIIINPDKELWLTIGLVGKLAFHDSYGGDGTNNAFFYRIEPNTYWCSNPIDAWTFSLGLGNVEYSYNLYRNEQAVAQGQTTTYTGTYSDGMNEYHVTSVANGYESKKSNSIMLVESSASQDELSISTDDKLIVLPNSTLTVSSLINDNPANLILENGAQLFHNNECVKATVKKNIDPFTVPQNHGENKTDGWYFIASPIVESIVPNADNGLLTNTYDLFGFDQSEDLEWHNHQQQNFDINNKVGYLYANSGKVTLSFAGTLATNVDATILDFDENAPLKGFNLIGNPYPYNTVIDNDFYVADNDAIVLAENGREIAPCEGVMVKAVGKGETVSFALPASSKDSQSKACFDLLVTQGKASIDRARVRFGEGIGMEKFSLNDSRSQISFWQDEKHFAVAYTNGQDEMPVSFKVAKNGTYTIVIENNSLELDYLHLIDNMTGDDINLLTMPSYTFEAKTTDYANRFRLVFSENGDSSTGSEATNFAYISNGEIVINGATNVTTLQIVDVMGRVIACRDGVHTLSTTGIPAGLYVLRLIDGHQVKTQKVLVP